MVRPVTKDLQSYEPYYRPTHASVQPSAARSQSVGQNMQTLVGVAVIALAAYAHYKYDPLGLSSRRRR